MSEFSQSFFMGENTLESLEKQAGKSNGPQLSTPTSSTTSVRRKTTRSSQAAAQAPCKRQSSDELQQLEVIEESPTNSSRGGAASGGNETRQKSVRERLKTIGTQSRSRKGFRRNKSDSITAKPEKKQTLKSRSESREQINLMVDNYSELFRSDVGFDGLSGRVPQGKQSDRQEINISKLLESDISFEIPKYSGSENKPGKTTPSPPKIPRQSDEFADIFGSSDFSMDLHPRSQSMVTDARASNDYEELFDQTAFTLEVPVQQNQPEPLSRELLNNFICSEDLCEFSGLQESSRVRDDDDVEVADEDVLSVENVNFTQMPMAAPRDELKQMDDLLTQQMELSKRAVIESLRSQVQPAHSATFCQTLNQTIVNSSLLPKFSSTQQLSKTQSPRIEAMVLNESKNLRQVANWGLPDSVTKAYAKKGVTELFQWQSDCLANAKVILECANLVYRAPTSGGKTLVSEFLVAKTVVERKRKAIVILPFVAVAREKMYYLQEILAPAGIRVEGFFGGHTPPGGFDSVDVAVCTIEKANAIVNRLLEQQKLADIGLIVVDEVHLISDPSRGYILELLLTKVRFVCTKLGERIQIVAMSATLPNMELLTEWLQAEQFQTDFRPIELKEMVKLGTSIYDNQGKLIRKLDPDRFNEAMRDQDNIAQLCLETILEGCSVIVFCPSKDWCERLTLHLAEFIYRVQKSQSDLGEKLQKEMNQEKLEEALSLLKNCPTGLDMVLGKTARYGCVYHHAGLTGDERDIIESCFKNGTLRVIVATSTLSSGVNLPARRVIIRTPMFAQKPMSALTYRQMIGRAGRKGRDILGESILMCDEQNKKVGWGLVSLELTPIASCLSLDGYSHLKRAILEIVASGVASTTTDLETFVNCTLYSCEKQCPFSFNSESLKNIHARGSEGEDDENPVTSCVKFLLEYEFIRLQENVETGEKLLIATQLGSACLASSMSPREGFLLFSELQKARQCFVLETELHAIYLVTPYSVCISWNAIDWMSYLNRWESLSPAMKRVGELVGVRDSFIVKAWQGKTNAADYHSLQIHKRFYTALALQELIDEKELSVVAGEFVCSRGLLQGLQQMAAAFAGVVTMFCTSLNWTLLAKIVTDFKDRLYFGIQHDLLDLMRISSLNGQRARLLFNGGITTLIDLANADPMVVERIMYNCVSFQTEQKREGEDEFDARRRMNLRNLYVTGKAGLTVQEAAKLLVKEARSYIQLDTGVCNPDWQDTTVQEEIDVESLPEKVESNRLDLPGKRSIETPVQHDIAQDHSSRKQTSVSSFEVSETDSNRDIECFHNSLIMNFSHVLSDDKVLVGEGGKYDSIDVVDLSANVVLFKRFQERLGLVNSVSVSFAICKFDRSKSVIGGNLLINQQTKGVEEEIIKNYPYVFGENLYLSGAAFTFPERGEDEPDNVVYYLNLRKGNDVECSLKQQMIRNLFLRESLTVDMLDAKDQLKMVYRAGLLSMDQELMVNLRDPKVACWLLQAEEKVIPLLAMVQQYCPEMSSICQLAGRSPGSTGPALNHMSTIDAKIRCTVESFLVRHMIHAQVEQFGHFDGSQDMLATFVSREMPVHSALIRMELVGFPADSRKLAHLIDRLKQAKERISDRVRKMNGGRKLDFGSSSEVAAALKVPRDRNGRAKTTKQVLGQIDSPLANLVISYRKIESNLSRTIEPLYRAICDGRRVYGSSYCFTSTGRITMHEPNLQTVVRDFEVEIDPGQKELFSCRSTFTCSDSTRVLLSADFCQLELCVLTHLSQDRKLLAAMSGGKDVFRSIAARWNRIEEHQVSDEMRNDTKAIVYGVIYGMGAKAMAAELNVDEDQARTRMEQFHSTYPEIRRYADKVVQITKERGYIETLTGRRRYLPAIHSTDAKKRSEAERQAVCTTVQGSAADILKNAILRMIRNMRKYRGTLGLGQVELVLHMHDELIFEVPKDQAKKVARILKSSMENCAKLSLPLRVKVKVGPSWELSI